MSQDQKPLEKNKNKKKIQIIKKKCIETYRKVGQVKSRTTCCRLNKLLSSVSSGFLIMPVQVIQIIFKPLEILLHNFRRLGLQLLKRLNFILHIKWYSKKIYIVEWAFYTKALWTTEHLPTIMDHIADAIRPDTILHNSKKTSPAN